MHGFKHSPVEPSESASFRPAITKQKEHSVELSTVPIEISWHAAMLPPKPREHGKSTKKKTIPNEISISCSSCSVQSDLESEARPRSRSVLPNVVTDDKQRDFHNKCICLELLESECFDDNCVGMEHLVSMANKELVNSSRFVVSSTKPFDDNHKDDHKTNNNYGSLLASSICYSLVCNNKTNRTSQEFSERLRAVFPSFLRDDDNSVTDSTASLSSSSFSPSCSSSKAASSGIISHQNGENYESHSKTSLRPPALRILVSSLELVSATECFSKRRQSVSTAASGSSAHSIDLMNDFWRSVLAYMTQCLQDLVVLPVQGSNDEDEIELPCSIETALVVKGFRLLYKLQPELMSPYLRYSLLPFVSNARDFGFEQQQLQQNHRKQCHKQTTHKRRQSSSGDKMLIRECERLLRSFP